VPSTADMQKAFQEYVSSVADRQQRGERLGPDERIYTNRDSNVRVSGVGGVMNIDAMATKMIFDHNKDKHPFFVEESYVIPWMYPYMEPHGLILKLNKEPLTALDPAVVTQDRQYWEALTKELLADRHFTGNAAARRTFSKLRSAIGGLYAYRRMTTESEAAFKQAVQLCPTSPEGNFRLAQLYMENGRYDDAIAVLTQLQKLDPLNDKIKMAIEQVRQMTRQAGEKQAK
jgi:tetratricopeptide (TPR) repeat protein